MSKYKLRREDITGFARNLKREERSPGTIAKYLRDVNAFALWLGDRAAGPAGGNPPEVPPAAESRSLEGVTLW